MCWNYMMTESLSNDSGLIVRVLFLLLT